MKTLETVDNYMDCYIHNQNHIRNFQLQHSCSCSKILINQSQMIIFTIEIVHFL